MVWTLHPETLLFTERYREHMGKYQWAYTWACQFSPSDTRLMVGGVANAVGGEMAIYDTGEWEGPPSRINVQWRYVSCCLQRCIGHIKFS